MKIRVSEVLSESANAFIFWMIIAIPVALFSAILSAWPADLGFPWRPGIATFIGILLGIAILWGYKRRAVETTGQDTMALPLFRTAIVSMIIAVVVAFLSGTAWAFLTKEPIVQLKLIIIVGISNIIGIVSFALFGITYKSRWVSRHIAIIWDRKSRKSILFGLFLSLTIGVICLVFWYLVFSDRTSAFFTSMINNPGGVFAFIIGVATLAGVYMTIMSMAEQGKTITTFPELTRRLISLIEGTTREDEYVRYLCYTPLTGSWAVPQYLSRRFYDLMVDQSHRISVIALDRTDLKEWYLSFVGRITSRGQIDQSKALKEFEQSEGVINNLENQARNDEDSRIKPVRLRFHQMPGFYFFSNEERAMIVSPVFLPLPRGTSKETQIHKLESVQVVGIETVDPGVVSWINKLHEVYRIDVSKISDFLATGEAGSGEISKELARIMSKAQEFTQSIAAEKGKGKVAFRLHVYNCEENDLSEG